MTMLTRNNLLQRRATSAEKRDVVRRAAIESLESRMMLSSVVVNSTADSLFAPGSGMVSLRNAIAIANSGSSATTISFDPSVFATPQTIQQNGTRFEFTGGNTSIIGPAAGVTIDGGNGVGGFVVDLGATVSISGLGITHVTISGLNGGGVITNSGTLNLTDDAIFGNSTLTYEGTGLYNFANTAPATITATNVTIANNTGGGIWNYFGAITLINSTVFGNSSTGNSTNESAGGVENFTDSIHVGHLNIANSVIAGNIDTGSGGPDVNGAFNSEGNNFIAKTDGSTGWTGADTTGTIAAPLNPNLGAWRSTAERR